MSSHRHYIQTRLRLEPVPGIPEISLFTAHPGSGLTRRTGGGAAPYWAYAWAGGLALVRYLFDHPEEVAGRTVFDIGAGSGLVAISAARLGAARVTAAEVDAYGAAAIALNAEANAVGVTVVGSDVLGGELPDADVIVGGDVFYDATVAARMLPFLERCNAARKRVLIGDPCRRDLPRERLRLLAEYRVGDVGSARDAAGTQAGVFTLGDGAA